MFIRIILLFFLLPAAVQADVLVLVHGYASNSQTWERSGINHLLRQSGWQQRFVTRPDAPLAINSFYAVDLPAHESLWIQSQLLRQQLQVIHQLHLNETITLAGHSAGGLVARLAVLNGNPGQVDRLVTIATPHLGTPRALRGLEIVDDVPFFCPGPGWKAMTSLFGGDDYDYLKHSRRALIDMIPAGRNYIVDWANHQPHPNMEYHAVVRTLGDRLVPANSQDMNQIPALRGKAYMWPSAGNHFLSPADGLVLLRILNQDY